MKRLRVITAILVLALSVGGTRGQGQTLSAFDRALKLYRSGQTDRCLSTLVKLYDQDSLRDIFIFNGQSYNAEAIALNLMAKICQDQKNFEQAKYYYGRMILRHGQTPIAWPFPGDKEADYYGLSGVVAMNALFNLYSSQVSKSEKDFPKARGIAHRLMREFPKERITHGDGYSPYIDLMLTRTLLSIAEEDGADSLRVEIDSILNSSQNPLCIIAAIDAKGLMQLREGRFDQALSCYDTLLQRYSDYSANDGNLFVYKDIYRVRPYYTVGLFALEQVISIYSCNLKDTKRAIEACRQAYNLVSSLMVKGDWRADGFKSRRELYELLLEGRFSPECPIIEEEDLDPGGKKISWHPDGNKIAFVTYKTGKRGVFEVNIAEGGRPHRLIGPASTIQYSSNGAGLFYVWRGKIWYYNLDMGTTLKLTSDSTDGWIAQASVAPGDTLVACTSKDTYVLNFRSRTKESLPLSMTNISWSGDGKTLIGIGPGGYSRSCIVKYNLQTRDIRRYSFTGIDGGTFPSYSPMGEEFVYYSVDKGCALLVRGEDESAMRLIFWYGVPSFGVAWSHDGQYIAYLMADKIFVKKADWNEW